MAALFSKTYLKEPAGQTDGVRFRQRLAIKALTSLGHRSVPTWTRVNRFASEVMTECGCDISYRGSERDIDSFFKEGELRDILDAVTILARFEVEEGRPEVAKDWIQFCARAMREEGMAYEVAQDGSVRYVIDVAFEETADNVISALQDPRFKGARTCIQTAVDALTHARPDGKLAIRATFEGLETIFKIVTNDNKDLTMGNAEKMLQPIVSRGHRANADAIAQGAAEQLVQSFKDGVNACHKYRRPQ